MKNSNKIALILLVAGLLLGLSGGLYYLYVTSQKASNRSYILSDTKAVNPTKIPMREMSVTLLEQNKSTQTGVAKLTEMDGKVTVMVTIKNPTVDKKQPTHIHLGYCPNNVKKVIYSLTPLENGTSETMLDVTFDDFKKDLPLAINIHKSEDETKVYTACGDLFSE